LEKQDGRKEEKITSLAGNGSDKYAVEAPGRSLLREQCVTLGATRSLLKQALPTPLPPKQFS